MGGWPQYKLAATLTIRPVSTSKEPTQNMASDQHPLHIVLVPWLAQGHMIPMVDISRLLAARPGVSVTIITTPVNAARIQPTIDRIAAASLPIHFLPLHFPAVEAGLPEGCENLDSIPSRSLIVNFFSAAELMKQPLLDYLHLHHPSCLITDMGHPWTRDVARELGVPRFIFHGFNCFSILSIHNLFLHKTHESAISDSDTILIPGLPHRIEISRRQLPRQFHGTLEYPYIYNEVREGELSADGYVINSFHELEPDYAEFLARATSKKVWMIGPVSLFNKGKMDISQRGNKTSVDESSCLRWLDSKEKRSVIYVSFGSMGSFKPIQLKELGMGLLNSGINFVWVIKEEVVAAKVEEWLSEKFNESRCLVIRGWAPQVMILSHEAVGGFLTHCGWNSTLESVCAGVPMVTWPMFAEQFLNEKVVVEVLGIGVSVGVEKPNEWGGTLEGEVVVVRREKVEGAVRRLMNREEMGEEKRRRAEELSEKAKRALEEGGSSYLDMSLLVKYVENQSAEYSAGERKVNGV